MNSAHELSPTRRKRLLKTYGPCPAGCTHEDIERFLDRLYRLFSNLYTPEELRQIIVSDPFDASEPPRRLAGSDCRLASASQKSSKLSFFSFHTTREDGSHEGWEPSSRVHEARSFFTFRVVSSESLVFLFLLVQACGSANDLRG